MASSTLSALVPLPMDVGPFPPAFPPTAPETTAAQSLAEAPWSLSPCIQNQYKNPQVIF